MGWYYFRRSLRERTVCEIDTIIQADELRYRYGDDATFAVDGVTFTVERGAFVTVLGRNGSGKSTLAKLLNALDLCTSGSLTVAGIPADGEAHAYSIRTHCGMVFQNADNQIVSTIVEEDVAFGCENLGIPPAEIRARVDRALAVVGMSAYAQSAPNMLSGGQKQRIAIAGVVAMQPDIIVFDESTSMLDPVGRQDIFALARQLNRACGTTVVWITHFMEEAVQSDHVLVMDGGRIAMAGTPRDVFTQADALTQLGLEAPEMVQLGQKLRAAGLPIPEDIMTVEEMAVALCRLKS